MAVIENERDKILQAAAVRLLPVDLPPNIRLPTALPDITLSAPTNFFKVAANGTGTPANILITAKVTGYTDPVVWSVPGGDGFTIPGPFSWQVYVTPDSMADDSMTIRATVAPVGKTPIAAEITISKLRDGVNATGSRQGVTASITVPTPGFDIARAAQAIRVVLGYAPNDPIPMQIGDICEQTYFDATGKAAWNQTRFWDGNNWLVLNHFFDGNMLVRGTVSAYAMSANSITADNFALGAGTVDSAKIVQQIQSDGYVYDQAGWAINKNGQAAFASVRVYGSVAAGTILTDRQSGYQLLATAVANAQGDIGYTGSTSGTVIGFDPDTGNPIYSPGDFQPWVPGGALLGGPNFHNMGNIGQRLRVASTGNPIVIQVSVTATVDHHFSLFVNQQGDYGYPEWRHLAYVQEAGSGIGAAALFASFAAAIGPGTWIRFGVAACDRNYNFYNNADTSVRFASISVFACNV